MTTQCMQITGLESPSQTRLYLASYFTPMISIFQCLNILGNKFGFTMNSKGYKMLPPYLRLIQGDGVSYETLKEILDNIKKHKWSSENVTFGSGGALLQKVNRDTQKCAYKCSYALINGKPVCLLLMLFVSPIGLDCVPIDLFIRVSHYS